MAKQTMNFKSRKFAPQFMDNAPGNRLPSYVKCKVCGGPPRETDWLKPVNPDPNCREFIHLSHIPNGPELSKEAGWIARNK